MKNKDFKDFDLSNFIELTEDQLRFEVNGGSKKSSSGSSGSSTRSNSSSSSSSSRGRSSSSTSKTSSSNTSTTTSSSSSYGSYVGYSGNGSGSRGSSLQATMNATRHDPDYKEAQNKGNAVVVDKEHPTGELTSYERDIYINDPDLAKNTNLIPGSSYACYHAINKHSLPMQLYKRSHQSVNPLKQDRENQSIIPLNEFDPIAESIAAVGERAYDKKLKYQCDNYVEDVLTFAGKDWEKFSSGPSNSRTVQEHINSLKSGTYTTTIPNTPGYYVVYMNEGIISKETNQPIDPHAGILAIDNDGNMKVWHNSSDNTNVGDNGGLYGQAVTKLSETKLSYFGYNAFYFQKIE